MVTEIEIDHSVGTGKDKGLDPTTGGSHKTDIYNVEMTVGEETIDARIIITTEVTVERGEDKTLGETLVLTIGIEGDQEKEI